MSRSIRAHDDDANEWCPPLDRRAALQLLGAGAVGFLAGCGGASNAPTGPSGSGCGATLEGEEGPFFVADSASGYLRSAVRTNIDSSSLQPGVPLALTITVRDAKKSCVPIAGVQVDIWSCNASGVYSGEASQGTTTESWLRGYQITDASGQVTFLTLVPGWYAGRATHIHLRLRSVYDSAAVGGTNTTQLFFDQTAINDIHAATSPYLFKGINPTTNASDRVFSQQVKGTNILAITGSTAAGYSSAITVSVPITT